MVDTESDTNHPGPLNSQSSDCFLGPELKLARYSVSNFGYLTGCLPLLLELWLVEFTAGSWILSAQLTFNPG